MKKTATLLLALLYLVSVSGAGLHFHYCMGKMQYWNIGYDSSKDDCPVCGMTQKKGCCEDQHHSIQTDKQYASGSFQVTINKVLSEPIHHTIQNVVLNHASIETSHSFMANAPPGRIATVPLFIQNCVYRI